MRRRSRRLWCVFLFPSFPFLQRLGVLRCLTLSLVADRWCDRRYSRHEGLPTEVVHGADLSRGAFLVDPSGRKDGTSSFYQCSYRLLFARSHLNEGVAACFSSMWRLEGRTNSTGTCFTPFASFTPDSTGKRGDTKGGETTGKKEVTALDDGEKRGRGAPEGRL
jgi:hypothetical protein